MKDLRLYGKKQFNGNLDYIDSLKGWAILAVTFVHSGSADLPGIAGRIYGSRGVQMFFLVSGLLSMMSAQRHFKDRKNVNINRSLCWFYKKIARLLPAYYLALAICIATKSWEGNIWLGNEQEITILNILAHVLFIHGFFPHYVNSILCVDWYIGVLIIFIIITPIIYYLINSLEKAIIFNIVIYIIYPFLNNGLYYFFPIETDPSIYGAYIVGMGPLANILVYAFGVLLYFVLENINNIVIKNKKQVAYSLIVLALFLLYGQINGVGIIYRLSVQDVYGIYFFLVIISLALYPCCILDNSFFRLFGKNSYIIYLFQFVTLNINVRYFIRDGVLSIMVFYMVNVAELLLISILVTKFFDTPLRRFLEYHGRKIIPCLKRVS